MVVTINTDASFVWATKKGAYAFNINSNEFRLEKSGKFRVSPDSSPRAESYAIINATTFFIQHVWPYYKVTRLIFYTDSLICVNAMNKPNHRFKANTIKMGQMFKNQMDALLSKHNIRIPIEFNWVKGHQANPRDTEGIENKWCDSAATSAMEGYFFNNLIYFTKNQKITNFSGNIIIQQ